MISYVHISTQKHFHIFNLIPFFELTLWVRFEMPRVWGPNQPLDRPYIVLLSLYGIKMAYLVRLEFVETEITFQ